MLENPGIKIIVRRQIAKIVIQIMRKNIRFNNKLNPKIYCRRTNRLGEFKWHLSYRTKKFNCKDIESQLKGNFLKIIRFKIYLFAQKIQAKKY